MNIFAWAFAKSRPEDRNWSAALQAGIVIGLVSPLIKSGTEALFPPWGPDVVPAPPMQIMTYWGFQDPWFTILGNQIPWGVVLHIFLAFVTVFVYCLVAEVFPRVTLWRGFAYGLLMMIILHVIMVPLLSTMPGLFGPDTWKDNPWNLPFRSNFDELMDHLLAYWIYEEMRKGIRYRVTGQPDPLPLDELEGRQA